MKNAHISMNKYRTGGTVSSTLFGLFWEDINYSCDGGLNANMVRNYSFDEVYLVKRKASDIAFVTGRIKTDERLATEADPLRYWSCAGGKLTAGKTDPVSENSGYANISVNGSAKLENLGYNGRHAGECAMSIQDGMTYTLCLYVRSSDFTGTISACVCEGSGSPLTDCGVIPVSSRWEKVR